MLLSFVVFFFTWADLLYTGRCQRLWRHITRSRDARAGMASLLSVDCTIPSELLVNCLAAASVAKILPNLKVARC